MRIERLDEGRPVPPGTRTRLRTRARRAGRALGWMAVVLGVVLALLGWRLTQGALHLPQWTVARLEARVGRDIGPRALTLGTVAIAYDVQARALRLRLRGAGLEEVDGTPLVTVPDAWVALDAAALLAGRLRPRVARVEGLAVTVARDAGGRFALAVGDGALPSTWAEALDTLGAALATPVVADLTEMTVTGITLRLTDAATGLDETVRDGAVIWARDGAALRLSLSAALDLGGRRAGVELALERAADGAARARVAVADVSLAGLAATLPGVPALALAQGHVAAEAAMAVSAAGEPGPLRGRLTGRDLRLADRPALRLDRATLGFAWPPGADRVAVTELAASSDAVSMAAEGQVLLEDGLAGPVQVQLRLGPTTFDPEALLDRRARFEAGVLTARLTQAPLAFDLGQAELWGASGTARLSGRLAFAPGGPEGTLRLDVPRMGVADLLALWPRGRAEGARRWFAGNIATGTARDAVGLLRLAPGEPGQVEASVAIEDATLRYMRDMPPIEGASGAAQLSGERFSVRVDAGTVPAPGEGRLDVAGTSLTIPDARARPPAAEVDLRVAGAIGDVLAVLDNPPFRLLSRLGRDADLATGRAEARVDVRFPLRPGNVPADVDYAATVVLRDVESRALVPGRTLAAARLALEMTPEGVSIAGDMTLAGVPFSGRWEQALPPPSTEPPRPGAPPAAPRPLPSPGRVTGTARLDAAGLARLGVTLAALEVRGAAEAAVTVTLPQGGPPRLSLASDLDGMDLRLPAIGWSKPASRAAALALEATLGTAPEITRVTVDAPGLRVEGEATFRAGGALDAARFQRVDTGWFRGRLVLAGRGVGAAPSLRVPGGTADLRGALAALRDGGGEPAPIDLELDRLQVTDAIALTDLRATLRGASGRFTGRINGGAQVAGLLGPDIEREGIAVQVSGADAGGVLRSAGLFEDGVGGTMAFTLRPTPQAGAYDGAVRIAGLRVRNAPALASLLQAMSVVGIVDQLRGEGLSFPSVEADFVLRPGGLVLRRASAVGPSMSITGDGAIDTASGRIDVQGVISPLYVVNGLVAGLFAPRDEGLFGFTYRLTGATAAPVVTLDPLSILTPGAFRDIFRRPPPS